MGNSQDKPHASITHHLSREMVSRAALRKEFREYAGLCCSTMSRARLIQFGQDMYHTLGVPVFDTSLQAVPDKEYTFEQFEEFFLSLCPSDVPLSVSLRDCQKTETTNRDEIVFQRSCADVRWATLITPENEDEYCVPGKRKKGRKKKERGRWKANQDIFDVLCILSLTDFNILSLNVLCILSLYSLSLIQCSLYSLSH